MIEPETLVRKLYESAFDPEVVGELVAEDLQYHLPNGHVGVERS